VSDDPELPDGELLTLDKAAAAAGWKGKYRWERKQRYLIARERVVGRPIMSRNGAGGDARGRASGRRYKVTRGALRRHCPELFEESLDAFVKIFRKTLSEIDSKIERKIVEHPKIQALERGQRSVKTDLKSLKEQVEKIL
jgi:hypothetical protein